MSLSDTDTISGSTFLTFSSIGSSPGLVLGIISRRKKSDSKAIVKPSNRSRHGCEECKRRRIKCDEAKPHCSKCQKKGSHCVYKVSLHYRDDFEKRGKSFGREGVWSKKGGTGNSTSGLMLDLRTARYLSIRNVNALKFVNYSVHCFVPSYFPLGTSLNPSIIPVDTFGAIPDESDTIFALNYYLDYVSPIFDPVGHWLSKRINSLAFLNSVVDIDLGLEISKLIQYSQSHNHVFYMMLALGSIYLSKLDQSSYDWRAKSRDFKKLGMSAVQSYLASQDELLEIYTIDHLLSFVLLMLYELADDCNENWRIYLVASRRILFSDAFLRPLTDVEISLLDFCLELLDYQETMGRTACKDKNSFFLFAEEGRKTLTYYNAPKVRISWMACDKRLVHIVSDITDFSFERFNGAVSDVDYKLLCDSLRSRLLAMDLELTTIEPSLDQPDGSLTEFRPLDSSLMQSESDIEEVCFLMACELKRLATLIYFECCLLNKAPHETFIQELVKKVFRLLEFILIQNSFKWCATLLWSLFVASSEIYIYSPICEELRYLTLEMLDRIELRSLGNVSMTREIITSIWKSRDVNPGDTPVVSRRLSLAKTSLMGFKNDWERFVVDKTYKISLA